MEAAKIRLSSLSPRTSQFGQLPPLKASCELEAVLRGRRTGLVVFLFVPLFSSAEWICVLLVSTGHLLLLRVFVFFFLGGG